MNHPMKAWVDESVFIFRKFLVNIIYMSSPSLGHNFKMNFHRRFASRIDFVFICYREVYDIFLI